MLLCEPVTRRIDSAVDDGGCGLDRLAAASCGEQICQANCAGNVCQMAQSPVVLECPEEAKSEPEAGFWTVPEPTRNCCR